MRVNRSVLGWGVFFIVVGLVPLAVRADLIDAATVRRAWELWPLILIGIGLGLVLQRTRAAIVGGLVVAVTFGLMAGSVLAVGFGPVVGLGSCGLGGAAGSGQSFPAQSGTLAAVATVSLELDCGELSGAASDGNTWQLAGRSSDGTPPEIAASPSRLAVRSPDRHGFDLIGGTTWEITLPRAPRTRLDLSVNAGSARLDLAGTHLTDLSASVNAGEAHLDLSAALATASVSASVNAGSLSLSLPAPEGTLSASLSANAGSINVCVPEDVGLRIETSDSALGSYSFGTGARGLTRNGNVWTNDAGLTGASRIELHASANLGSITLKPESGCD